MSKKSSKFAVANLSESYMRTTPEFITRLEANEVFVFGSVVTHDIPENTIAAGNPARVIKKIEPKRTKQ